MSSTASFPKAWSGAWATTIGYCAASAGTMVSRSSAACRSGRITATTGRTMARRAMSVSSSTAASGSKTYVPAGGDIPDRDQNPKFGQKLDYIERMTRWSEKCGCPTLLVGDFNVAPLECDVWRHKQLINVDRKS